MTTKECAVCTNPFKARAKHQLYCSKRCKDEARRTRQRMEPAHKECVVCGEDFRPYSSNQLTCSKRCAAEVKRARRRKAVSAETDAGLQVMPDGSRSAVNDAAPAPWKAEDVIRAHGDDPEQCVILRQRGNRWGPPEEPYHQLRVDWVRRADLIQAPDVSDWEPIPEPKPRKRSDKPLRGFVISDHHAPRHEPTFHRLVVERLRERQPDVIDINGDLNDFPDVSTHRTREEYNHSVNECLKASVGILRDYRHACPNARIVLKRGNHDERLDIHQIDHAPELRQIAPGGGKTFDGDPDERPWHDLSRLLYLDRLHVEYVDEHWEQAKTMHTPKLTTRHGFSTSPSAGKTMLEKLSGSTIQGHDHRLALTLRTRHTGDPDDPLEVRMAMSGGCACIIPGGLGYIRGGEPDWQNAAAELTIWPDGDFHACPIIYVPGRLLCFDKRFEA